MKKLILIAIFICLSFNLSSKDQQILPLEDKAYEYIDYLYLLTNSAPPTSAKPYSISQMRIYLNGIDYNKLNTSSIKYFNYLLNLVNEKDLDIKLDDKSSIDVNGITALEIYAHYNDTDIKTNRDWIYDQENRLPLLKLELDINVDEIMYTTCEMQYQMGKYEPSDDSLYYIENSDFFDEYAPDGIGTISNNSDVIYNILTNQYNNLFSTNIPLASKYIDFDTPKRALLSVGGENWNFNYSKDTLEWGNSIIGNFIFDDHLINNYINYKYFSKNFNLNNTVAFYNTQTESGENIDDEVKMYFTHRLEFKPTTNFRFAISENVMYQNEILSFLYFNPAYIYHNINNRSMFNAIASLETDFYLFNNISWYSQFVLDQARAPNEDDSQSAAWGFSTGLRYTSILNDNILNISAEALIATPCLYRRDEVDFITFTKTFVINQSYVIEPTFIGFEEGGDSLAFKLQAEYNVIDKFNIITYYYLLLKGEVDIYTATHINNDGTTTNDGKPNYGDMIFKNGIYSMKHVVYSGIDYKLYTNKYISISNITTLSFIFNKTIQPTESSYSDLQFSTGISISF
ncbi:MAG: hypothetical protein ACPKM0_09320 [Pleomorphochaeta sp.]